MKLELVAEKEDKVSLGDITTLPEEILYNFLGALVETNGGSIEFPLDNFTKIGTKIINEEFSLHYIIDFKSGTVKLEF